MTKKINSKKEQKVIVAMYKSGHSIRDVASRYKVSFSSMYNKMRFLKVDFRRNVGRKKVGFPLEEVIKGAIAQGKSLFDISSDLDIHPATLRRKAKENGFILLSRSGKIYLINSL